ncbi:MARVEL domain-containing protein 3 [Oryzias melastigma]|uniref:Si:ch211-191a24.4 n=1 Tax=Oryzias melastigma TaxID=30732 RepID=A0A3B3DKI5_ORYME|nr:MARVEL domain-containing protein 3 [Oryzias melastigma]XP_024133869.1 MARVEL domain-containing protein 3 [Oryzias melastigma]XP_036067498.1 MARVEL domain-containing protein 3 [Oryzias melastigma]
MSQPSGSNEENPDTDGGQQGETNALTGGTASPSQDRSPGPRHSLRFRILRFMYKCMDILTRRGIVLICTVLTNALVLVCVVSAQSGIIDNNLNLQGTDLELVKDLNLEFSQKKIPGAYGGGAFSLIFGVASLVFAVAGSKPPLQMPQMWMKAAFVFQVVGAVLYVIAVGVYLHFVIDVNSTDECKQRERIYSRNGYTWINCEVGGADTAAAVFGLMTAILYTAGAVFTIQTFKRVSRFVRERDAEAKKQRSQRGPQ